MKFDVIGKNIKVTQAIHDYAVAKISKLDKYFVDKETETRVVVQSYKTETKAEVTIFADDITLRAEVRNEDLYAALDLIVDKLEGQMRKFKTKFEKRRKTGGLDKDIAYEQIPVETPKKKKIFGSVVREKEIPAEVMSTDEAIFRMEALGHSFFIYIDETDLNIHVVYKRHDNDYGRLNIIEQGTCFVEEEE